MNQQDRPKPGTAEYYTRMSRACFQTAPFGGLLGFALMKVQGAEFGHSLLGGAILLAGTLGAGVLIHHRGAKAASDAGWIAVLLRLVSRR